MGDRRSSIAFESALEKGGLGPTQEAIAWLHVGDRHRAEGRPGPARECYERSARIPVQDPALRAEIERRLK